MRYRYYIALIGLLTFSFCSYPRYEQKKESEFTLFVSLTPYENHKFKIFVNDTLRYGGLFKEKYYSIFDFSMYIGNFPKGEHTKLRLKTQEKDTTFIYNTLNVDSLDIVFIEKVVIINNHNKNAWYIEDEL